MCTLYEQSPEDLYFKWEAYTVSERLRNPDMPNDLDMKRVQDFKAYLTREAQSKAAKGAKTSTPNTVKTRSNLFAKFGSSSAAKLMNNQLASTPTKTPGSQWPHSTSVPSPSTSTPLKPLTYTPKAQYSPPSNLSEYDCKICTLLCKSPTIQLTCRFKRLLHV